MYFCVSFCVFVPEPCLSSSGNKSTHLREIRKGPVLLMQNLTGTATRSNRRRRRRRMQTVTEFVHEVLSCANRLFPFDKERVRQVSHCLRPCAVRNAWHGRRSTQMHTFCCTCSSSSSLRHFSSEVHDLFLKLWILATSRECRGPTIAALRYHCVAKHSLRRQYRVIVSQCNGC